MNAVWPQAVVQSCIIHLIRGSFRYASKRYWPELAADLKPILAAPSATAAAAALDALEEKWGKPYPAISRLWRSSWELFTPFLDYDVEIRKVLCSTNAMESLNARYRRAVTTKGHFPTQHAALKSLYVVTRSLGPKGTGQARWVTPVEASPERLRRHLRRPDAGRGEPAMKTATDTVRRTGPTPAIRRLADDAEP